MNCRRVLTKIATIKDIPSILDIHHAAIHLIDPIFYSKEQLEAWSPSAQSDRINKFNLVSANIIALIAVNHEGTIIGFGTIDILKSQGFLIKPVVES